MNDSPVYIKSFKTHILFLTLFLNPFQLTQIHIDESIGLSFDQAMVQKDFQGQTFLVIGKDYEDVAGIKKQDGSVYTISDEGFIFMNSSVQMLEAFIHIFNSEIDFDEDYDEVLRKKQLKKVAQAMKKTDRPALKESHGWPFILEQAMGGLL
ncbi:MAG: SUKH-4 family immunity protein [Cytophagales bacterium]|nr:SUKH-4 family immunity protein [Cytophagales bacterium]